MADDKKYEQKYLATISEIENLQKKIKKYKTKYIEIKNRQHMKKQQIGGAPSWSLWSKKDTTQPPVVTTNQPPVVTTQPPVVTTNQSSVVTSTQQPVVPSLFSLQKFMPKMSTSSPSEIIIEYYLISNDTVEPIKGLQKSTNTKNRNDINKILNGKAYKGTSNSNILNLVTYSNINQLSDNISETASVTKQSLTLSAEAAQESLIKMRNDKALRDEYNKMLEKEKEAAFNKWLEKRSKSQNGGSQNIINYKSIINFQELLTNLNNKKNKDIISELITLIKTEGIDVTHIIQVEYTLMKGTLWSNPDIINNISDPVKLNKY